MNIGAAAEQSNVSAKAIRYYESIGLLPPAPRRDNGYRRYSERDVETLRFIQHARGLGFSVDHVGDLLALWRDKGRASADVRAMAQRHVADIERKVAELDAMRATLQDLITRCHGDDRPDCPIIDRLVEGDPQ